MIKLEEMLCREPGTISTETVAEIIISVVKKAYTRGYDLRYNEGSDESCCHAFSRGEEEGYRKGHEDGYNEGVMDLVEVDGYDEAFDNTLRTINEVYEEETWNI